MGALTRERVLVRLVARSPAHFRVIVRRILPYQLFWKTTPFFSPAGQFVTYRAHGDAFALPCRVPRRKRDGRFTGSAIYFAAVLSGNASERHRYPRDRPLAPSILAPRVSRVVFAADVFRAASSRNSAFFSLSEAVRSNLQFRMSRVSSRVTRMP